MAKINDFQSLPHPHPVFRSTLYGRGAEKMNRKKSKI